MAVIVETEAESFRLELVESKFIEPNKDFCSEQIIRIPCFKYGPLKNKLNYYAQYFDPPPNFPLFHRIIIVVSPLAHTVTDSGYIVRY